MRIRTSLVAALATTTLLTGPAPATAAPPPDRGSITLVTGDRVLLAERRPEWTGARLKAALVASAVPSAGANPYDQGAGRVDVPAAISQTVTAEPAAVNAGVVAFPHTTS